MFLTLTENHRVKWDAISPQIPMCIQKGKQAGYWTTSLLFLSVIKNHDAVSEATHVTLYFLLILSCWQRKGDNGGKQGWVNCLTCLNQVWRFGQFQMFGEAENSRLHKPLAVISQWLLLCLLSLTRVFTPCSLRFLIGITLQNTFLVNNNLCRYMIAYWTLLEYSCFHIIA